MDEEIGPVEEEVFTGTLEERLVHKNWKARKQAYEQLAVQQEFDAGLCDFFKGMINEPNANAQEAAIQALFAYFDKSSDTTSAPQIAQGVVDKILGALKPRTVQKGQELMLLLIEIGAAEHVMAELLRGLSKTPKIKLATLQICTEAIRGFGTSLPLKELLRKDGLLPLCEDRDGKVRQEALQVIREIYKYMGDNIRKLPFFAELRDTQQKELEKHFEEAKAQGRPTPSRQLRGQKAPVAASATAPAACSFDAGDLIEVTPVLSKLPKDFFAVVEGDGKWIERKKMLDVLATLAEAPKLQEGDYLDVVKLLKKLLNDTQIPLVSAAVKIIGNLASGLGQFFGQYTRFILATLLDKFKEKKTVVLEPLHQALFLLYQSGSLPLAGSHIEDIVNALQSKVPAVKQHTLEWLAKCIESTKTAAVAQKALDALGDAIGKLVDDANGAVRDGVVLVLSRFAAHLGQDAVAQVAPKIDRKQTEKLGQFLAKSTLPCDASTRPPSPPLKTARPDVARGVKRPAERPEEEPAAKRPQTARGVKSTPLSARGKQPTGPAAAHKRKPEKVGSDDLECGPTAAEVELRAAEIIPEDTRAWLGSKVLKERQDGVAKLGELVAAMPSDELSVNAEILLRVLKVTPGWKDSNMQVLNRAFQVATLIAQRATAGFHRRCVVLVMDGIADKIADVKQKQVCRDCLTAFCEAVGPRFVVPQLFQATADAKNPKTVQEILEWLTTVIDEFGPRAFDVKLVIEYIKAAFEKNNPLIKTAGTKALVTLYSLVGPAVRELLNDVKPQLLATIDAEFATAKQTAANVKRVVRGDCPTAAIPETSSGVAEMDVDALAPTRMDISAHVTPTLLAQLADNTWKTRQDALTSLETLLSRTKQITPSVGGLIPALKARLADSNKNIAMQAMRILGMLAQAMGAPVKTHLKAFFPGLLLCLADNKPQVRQAAIQAMQHTFVATGMEAVLAFLPKAMGIEGSPGRQDLCEWLASALSQSPALPVGCLSSLVKPVISVLQDRNAETRKHAEVILMVLLSNVGADVVLKETRDLKPAVGSTIRGLIEKHRPKPVTARPHATPRAPRTPPPEDQAVAFAREDVPQICDMEVDGPAPTESALEENLRKRPESPPSFDVDGAIDKLQTSNCIEALKALADYFGQSDRGAEVSADDINRLLIAIMSCLHSTFIAEPMNVRQLKFVLATLQSMFSSKAVSAKVTYERIFHTISALLDRLTDDRLKPSEDSSAVLVRGFNLLVLKILENSSRTHVLRTMLSRLHDQVTANRLRPAEDHRRHIDLTCKCLLKLAQFVPGSVEALDCVEILQDLHVFFTKNPPSSFHDADDVPLRSVRSFLAEVVKAKGPSIRQCLRTDPSSFLSRCVESTLQKPNPLAPTPSQQQVQPEATPEAIPAPAPVDPSPRVEASDADDFDKQLDQIFQDIRNKDITQEGIQALHNFMVAHPTVSVEPWLLKCSVPFQSYISRQLRKLQNPTEGAAAHRVISESLSLDALRASLQRQRALNPLPDDLASAVGRTPITQSRLSSNFQALEALRSSFEVQQSRDVVENSRH